MTLYLLYRQQTALTDIDRLEGARINTRIRLPPRRKTLETHGCTCYLEGFSVTGRTVTA